MKVEIHISPKKSVLDPQGQAVEQALGNVGFNEVTNCRVGKVISLELPDDQATNIDTLIAKMCDEILVNPIVETYTYKVLEATT